MSFGKRLLYSLSLIAIAFFIPRTSAAWQGSLPPSDLANGNVHIVAVMVEFQEDNNRFTTGNGKFNPAYLNSPDITIDPLPHDKGYFEAHLLFAKNYFERVSGGRLTVTYEVLPQIVTLPNEMAAYSPIGEDNAENFRLGNLAADTWNLVRELGLSPTGVTDPDRTMFVIFHAGAGRDIELTGTTLTKTPQDIPSVYLSKESMGRLLNDPSFNGIPLSNGLSAWNTAILPETQSRPGEDILGTPFVIEISINGILTATIGSFLGLPDLFNTETGQSGIGRFGLMDGAGFFSYFGLFPPEPSAWEKAYLGWVDPVNITPVVQAGGEVQLPAVSLRQPGSIVKYPISADEYFLVENRHRDIDGTGVSLTIRKPDGNTETVVITNDEDRFSPFDLSDIGEILPPGVLVDVSNFDWSLPGGLDEGPDRTAGTADDRLLNGGILIWHIDEQIIRAKIDDNAINNDPKRKGVKLVEADAAQDIGRPAGTLTSYAQGGPFDFWWSGNDFTVITQTGQRIVLYQNRFGDDTRPNNRSNSGARTYFEFYDFSDNLPVASFRARTTGSALFQPRTTATNSTGNSPAQSEANLSGYPLSAMVRAIDGDTIMVIPHTSGLTIANLNSGNVQEIPFENPHQPVWTSDNTLVVQRNPAVSMQFPVEIRGFRWNTGTRQFDQVWSQPISNRGLLSVTVPGFVDIDLTTERFDVATGDRTFSSPDGRSRQTALLNGQVAGLLEVYRVVTADGNTIFTIPGSEMAPGEQYRIYMAPVSPSINNELAFVVWTPTHLRVIEASGEVLSETSLSDSGWPVLSDWNNDGYPDIIYVNYSLNQIEARNLNGALLDGFPISAPESFTFSGSPLVVSPSSETPGHLFIPGTDPSSANIIVYSSDNLRFPVETLLVGTKGADNEYLVQPVIAHGNLFAASTKGEIKSWRIAGTAETTHFYLYGSPDRNKPGVRSSVVPATPGRQLLASAETYNWPNPARDHTYVRFQTSQEAEITLTVIGYSGSKLFEASASTAGGLPEEIRLDTSAWSSGVYFCRVTARSNGKTEHKVITMVITR